ncbi:unnamed protein product [Hermetia illucens]|uniref:Uncharacterized protein n=1 Tax=Hermetia illucens TaxID=343691 RepID=A0A7R8YUC0_HERIL|nr:unnamed protein product [Hermetia illucens]
MNRCYFCKRESNRFKKPQGNILKSIKKYKPQVTGETLMCTTCYKRAKDRLQEYIRRKQTEDESSRSNAVTTVGSMETASQDSFDRIVNQVSMRSVQRISREGRALVAEMRQSDAGTPSTSRRRPTRIVYVDETEEVVEERHVAESEQLIIPDNNNDKTKSLQRVRESDASSDPLNSDLIQEYYSSDDDTIVREDDPLPGVKPIVKRRRTPVVFADERLIPVFNTKTYGG